MNYWACGTYGGMRNVCTILVGKSEEMKPLGKIRHRWGYNIKIDIKKKGPA
jgi:hypothetical protein